MSILRTPLDIYNKCLEVFPLADEEVEVDGAGLITVTLKLSEGLSSLRLQNAVETRGFSEALKEIFKNIQQANLTHTRIPPLDVKRFSFETRIPLTDWRGFQRANYEKTGHRCLDDIIEYLQNPINPTTLLKLGLAPSLVERNCTENDLEYFRQLPKKLQKMKPEIAEVIVTNFSRLFPNVYRLVMTKITEEQLERSKASKRDEYDPIIKDLQLQVIGQDQAVEKLATTVLSQQRQEGNQVYLFVGPPGVGKTGLAKAIAKLKGDRFVDFRMQDYSQEDNVKTLFGSASGSAGSTAKCYFTLRLEPFAKIIKTTEKGVSETYEVKGIVLLFDDLEKAHSTTKQALLTIFEEGHCTVHYTRDAHAANTSNESLRYEFKNSIIICTSNLYHQQILESFRLGKSAEVISKEFVELNRDPRQQDRFSSELLNRVTVIPFGPIPRGQPYQAVIKLKMNEFFETLKHEHSCREVCVENEPYVLAVIEKKFYGDGTGLRRIENDFFSVQVKNKISKEEHLWGSMKDKKITFDCDQEGLFIKISTFNEDVKRYFDTPVPIIRVIQGPFGFRRV